MRSWLLTSGFTGVATALALVSATPVNGVAQEEHRVRGTEISVFNLAGVVEVVPGSGNEVVVEVMRGGSDAHRLEVGISQVDGREALIVRYPTDRVVYPELGRGSKTQTRVRSDGSFSGGWSLSGAQEVEISGSGSGMEAWADLRISVPSGQDFALYLAVGEIGARELTGTVLLDTGSGPVHAAGSRGELSIDTGSGQVTVDGFDGDLEVDTGSGQVELSNIRGGGEVRVDTGSGSVVGSGVSAAFLEVDTGSGEVELQSISSPDVTVDTGSGSVEIELLDDVDQLEIDTGAGSVTLWIPSSLGAQVEIDTGSGGIDLDVPFEVDEVKRDYVKGILGDGNGRIHVDTGSGGIRVRRR